MTTIYVCKGIFVCTAYMHCEITHRQDVIRIYVRDSPTISYAQTFRTSGIKARINIRRVLLQLRYASAQHKDNCCSGSLVDFDMEDNITTPLPFTDDYDEDSPSIRIWYSMLLILFAIVQLFFSLFSLSMVIYLSIRFKKKAWDSPAKRFGNILNVFITSTIFIIAIYNFCIVPLIISPHLVASSIDLGPIFYISISFPHISFLYLTAICVSLLLQIVSPFLHEKLKQCTRKTHCTIFTEVVCHILIFIVLTTLLYGFAKFKYPFHIDPEIGIFSMLFVLFFSSFLIFAFVVFLMKFFRNQNIALNIKYMIIKLIFILIIYITFNIASTIAIT